jgi:hypothetical protein
MQGDHRLDLKQGLELCGHPSLDVS